MSVAIWGLGTALPPLAISQSEAAKIGAQVCCTTDEQTRFLSTIYRRSGIRKRYSVLLEESNGSAVSQSFFAPRVTAEDRGPSTGERMQLYREKAAPLALAAARKAIDASALRASDVTHVITISCTGFTAPGIDIALVTALPLAPTVKRTHIGFMGCHGVLNGLQVAQAIAQAGVDSRVLVCAVELCSLHLHYGWDREKVVTNALFSDGAAALVAAKSGTPAAESTVILMTLVSTGSFVFPDTEDAMAWQIGDHGFEMTLSAGVPELLSKHLRPWFCQWLARSGLRLSDVRSWAIHPGGPRILSAVEQALGLDRAATAVSRDVLARCGNMSSPTILFILDRLLSLRAPRPYVALGFGPGLVVEAVLFS